MFALGPKSQLVLGTVHPDLAKVVREAITISTVDFGAYEGVRTKERQWKLFAEGKTRTKNSKHFAHPDGYGYAVDLVPWKDGAFHWDQWEPFYEIAAAMSNAAHGTLITWGGVWDRVLGELPNNPAGLSAAMQAYGQRHEGSDLYDGPHFQLGRN